MSDDSGSRKGKETNHTREEIAVRIDKHIAKELKVAAAQDGTTVKSMIERAAQELLRKRLERQKAGPQSPTKPRRG